MTVETRPEYEEPPRRESQEPAREREVIAHPHYAAGAGRWQVGEPWVDVMEGRMEEEY